MFAKLARTDLVRLRAAGFRPTDAEVVRLNDLAVRIERGKNTTVANMPRVAEAGNIYLHEPTIGALEWWHNFGRDAAWSSRGKLECYYWMLANADNPDAFEGLEKPRDIRRVVRKWRCTVFATESQLWRALMWVKTGEAGDAEEVTPAALESTVEDDATMDRLYASVIAAAGALSMRPSELRTETVDTLTALLIAANLHAQHPIKMSIAKDYIAYKKCLRSIEERGKAEVAGNG